MKAGQPARAGASSKASRSHQHIRRLASRRHFGGAEASTVSAAAAAAAAPLPASEVKSSPTASVLGAATGRPLRSASPRTTVWSNACPAGRASYGGFARARETRTPGRRDAAPRACISCGLTGPCPPLQDRCERRALSMFLVAASRLAARRSPPPMAKSGSRHSPGPHRQTHDGPADYVFFFSAPFAAAILGFCFVFFGRDRDRHALRRGLYVRGRTWGWARIRACGAVPHLGGGLGLALCERSIVIA